ncbi:MAG TPA: amidohydrolase, partial [Sphingomonadaceae bacterium]|nr:amidohydrolase [Sphingomonadaceae bacterium]
MKRFALAALLCAISPQVAAQDFAVTGATLALGDGSDPIANGTVVIREGKVVAAGRDVVFAED